MITDPSIRDQAYQYFLEEAPELLETIEQELFVINDGDIEPSDRPLRVNKLMRATHTLKGGAANVGLETIKTVAHSMEDVFKALYNPELEIDLQTKKLLYASYDCLRIPLTAEFSKAPIDREEILNRAAGIFAELTEIFGDYLSDQDAFPTSEELGLDVVQSFFESVVPERIQELSTALAEGNPDTMKEVLQSQAEIFLGLSQSLNLSGLGDIAQTILTALETNPDRVKEITEAAIANFQQAQQQVMDGDRDRGGEPSAELKQFTGTVSAETTTDSHTDSNSTADAEAFWSTDPSDTESELVDLDSDPSQDSMFAEPISAMEGEFAQNMFDDKPLSELNNVEPEDVENIFGNESLGEEFSTDNQPESIEDADSFFEDDEESGELMTQIWGEDAAVDGLEERSPADKSQVIASQESLVPTPASSKKATTPPQKVSTRDVRKSRFGSGKKDSSKSPVKANSNKTVRVNLESLEKLNDLVGELLINQNKNILKDEQIGQFVQQLLDKISYSEQIVGELIEVVDEVYLSPQQQQLLQELPAKLNDITRSQAKDRKSVLPDVVESPEAKLNQLLELTSTSNFELSNIAEKIKNHNKQTRRDTQKQQRMLLNMRDELIETRMSPIGRLFNRFPRLLKQLSVTHDKNAELNITGSHILIDKTIEEKLYDPLLHLVRNSFDHGLENLAERAQTNKPETGTVFLRAYYQGSQTVIEVGDDGKGIDIERIKQKGIEKGLISASQAAVTPPSQPNSVAAPSKRLYRIRSRSRFGGTRISDQTPW